MSCMLNQGFNFSLSQISNFLGKSFYSIEVIKYIVITLHQILSLA